MLLHESLFDCFEEIPVETSVDNEDEHFRDLVPNIVDLYKRLRDWWNSVRRDPYDKHRNVDGSDESDSPPLQFGNCTSMLNDQSYSVDDNLHKKLDFKNPKEENEEENRYALMLSAHTRHQHNMEQNSPGSQFVVQEQPGNDRNDNIHCNLTPYHVDIRRPQGISIPPSLLDSLPYGQDAKADREASSQSRDLKVLNRSRHVVERSMHSADGPMRSERYPGKRDLRGIALALSPV